MKPAPVREPLAEAGSIGSLLDWAATLLARGSTSPRIDAEVLLGFLLRRPRSHLIGFPERGVSPLLAADFRERVRRRADGVPVAHLVGCREFYSLELQVSPATLVPRPETELLVEKLLERVTAAERAVVLDAGTGCGAVALAVKRHRPGCRVAAVDSSSSALEVAVANGARLGLRTHWVLSHWFKGLADERFDFIVSNPPYVESGDARLLTGGLRHEPREALDGGTDGLACLREIIAAAPRALTAGGTLLVEHGGDQARAVGGLMRRRGFRAVETHQDLSGHDRVSIGSLP